ncbi:LYR motif containing protein 1 [Cichlidogyrus casuarinus]|uniref:LYR motif containing protein 1 n=1 Tax=Cichlidogyrus casuarinus TaxID=1844966 RepID=A0ABD2Q269_9PLAT
MVTRGALRRRVLELYKNSLKLARDWETKYHGSSEDARYIKDEARALFRRNAQIKDPAVINSHIKEAESRIELTIHYGNPHPRPANFPPRTLAGFTNQHSKMTQNLPKRTDRNLKDSVPSYLKSYRN